MSFMDLENSYDCITSCCPVRSSSRLLWIIVTDYSGFWLYWLFFLGYVLTSLNMVGLAINQIYSDGGHLGKDELPNRAGDKVRSQRSSSSLGSCLQVGEE